MDSNTRLRLATRIHFALLRHLGDTVEISDILHRPAQTREVLWVCDGSGDEELMQLAQQWREVEAHTTKVLASIPTLPLSTMTSGPAPQDVAWARDTSGFGVSRPPEAAPEAPRGVAKGWRKRMGWLRGKSAER